VHRSTYYAWKRLVDRHGLEMLRPRERRRPKMPNQLPRMIEEAAYEPPRDPGPERHIDVSRPGELVGIDCFYVGRLRGTEGKVWQLTAIDVASSFGWAELVVAKQGNPIGRQTSKLARRVAAHLETAGWRLERLFSDNGNEFKGSSPRL
jgi:hypothetical protein